MCFAIVLLFAIIAGSAAKVCHQDEISNGFESLQFELEMIQAEKEKCSEGITNSRDRNDSYCGQVFDGIMCWPAAQPGTVSIQPCPDYMYNVIPGRNASKTCLPTGEWYIHPYFNTTWTNLTSCYDSIQGYGPSLLVPAIIQKHLRYIQILYHVGYSISLLSLLIAVVIMLYFRNLHCQRNTIHINMFISFIFRSVICFVKDIYVLPEINEIYTNDQFPNTVSFGQSNGCKVVYTLFYYILSTNFMWIFIEGIYIHTFVQSTKYSISKRLYRTWLIFGWGMPVSFVIPWMTVRMKHENTLCWSTHDEDNGYYWIIKGPITVTVVINFIFFVNIIRVLYTKLTAMPNGNCRRYRKLAKSTLILIPLFGVYYIAFIAIPICMKPLLEVIWMYTEIFFNSFQGFAVSLLFCFMNEEVRKNLGKIKRKLKSRRSSHISNRSRSRSVTAFMYQSEHDVINKQEPIFINVPFEMCENGVANNNKDKNVKIYQKAIGNGIHTDEHKPML